jgi:hypothetical protein
MFLKLREGKSLYAMKIVTVNKINGVIMKDKTAPAK